MALEIASYISDLVPANPTGADSAAQGDNHLRLLKQVLQNTLVGQDQALVTGKTKALRLPAGTVADREGSPALGSIRFNSQTAEFEGFGATGWIVLGGQAASGASAMGIVRERFLATAAQTAFLLTDVPSVVGVLGVYINGVLQDPVDAYTVSGMTVTLSEGAELNDEVIVLYGGVGAPIIDAASVGYVPAGANAVDTDVQSKLREIVSIKDFGAVGDGVTDDTGAFQAATAASPNQGVLVPIASYVITGDVPGKFYSFGLVTILGGTVTTITNLLP